MSVRTDEAYGVPLHRSKTIRPRDVVIACFTGDNIVLSRAAATWHSWLQRAIKAGFQVAIIAQTARTAPFPVLGVGGGLARTAVRGASFSSREGLLDSTFLGYAALAKHFPHAHWFLKVDDDTVVHLRHLWSALGVLVRTNGEHERNWLVGDCRHYCGGSALLISRPTLVTLNLRSAKCKAFELSKGANHNIGSDTAIADCAMRRVGSTTAALTTDH